MIRIQRAAALALLATLLSCRSEAPSVQGPPVRPDGPKLLLLLVVDQMRADYLTRFDRLYTGGLRRLLDEGLVFTEANYDHAITVTGAGHATLATGRHPAHHGIIGNGWYDRQLQEDVYCFDDPDHDRSPRNLIGTTLGDWLKATDPRSRVYSVSGKDRSAIALGGHQADVALWYDARSGEFTTTSYYDFEAPEWLDAFHRTQGPDRRFGQAWQRLAVEPSTVVPPADVFDIDEGLFSRRFPYSLGGPSVAPGSSFYAGYRAAFGDEYLLQLARTIMRAERLGQEEQLDMLALGLSSLDLVGHQYGPNSPEVLDVLLRLDRELGTFLEFVDAQVGLDRTVIALSSDHGVAPVPEASEALGIPGRRFETNDVLCFQQSGNELRQRFGVDQLVLEDLYLDTEALEEAGVQPTTVEDALARRIEQCSIVSRVWTRAELTATRMDEPDRFRRLYRHSFHPDRSPDLLVQLVEYAIPSGESTRTTHGSPYAYDTHVPIVLRLAGVSGARITEAVNTVDLAPTLAAQLGLRAEGVDGADRTPLIRQLVPGFQTHPTYTLPAGAP